LVLFLVLIIIYFTNKNIAAIIPIIDNKIIDIPTILFLKNDFVKSNTKDIKDINNPRIRT